MNASQVSTLLQYEIAKYCEELGFRPVKKDGQLHITGSVRTLMEGSRVKRYLLPPIMRLVLPKDSTGAATVGINCQVRRQGAVIYNTDFERRKSGGLFGGDFKMFVKQSFRQLALEVGSEAGVEAGVVDKTDRAGAVKYLYWLSGISAILSFAMGWFLYLWAMSRAVRHAGLEHSQKPYWACFVTVMIFALLFFVGLAAAPERVLTSRQMLWLRSVSGVESINAQRGVTALLVAVPAALLGLAFYCL